MMEWVIDTNGLTKSYKQVNALKSLDLRVRRNSIFGFLGPNGAGKTTTIKLLLGLIRPTGGSATVFGLDIRRDCSPDLALYRPLFVQRPVVGDRQARGRDVGPGRT
jgi:ABC-type multidrug transport system ATPase subunit